MEALNKRRNEGQLVSVIIVSLLAAIVVVGFSIKKKPTIKVVEAVAEPMQQTDSLLGTMPVEESYPELEAVYRDTSEIGLISGATYQVMYNDSLGWHDPVPVEMDVRAMPLNCLLYDDDKVVLGGETLITAGRDYSEIYDEYDFGSPINVVLDFGEGYLVGTDAGLYYYNSEQCDTLFKEGINVSDMAEDVGGLWVGTFGDGLWRFDGEHWQRRYLLRDTSIFDFVNALTYSYPFLWVGTPSGIFRYNGGAWNQLFVADSSETYEVNCFLPQALSTYIGTEQGLFVYANDSLTAVPEFENERILDIFKEGKDILVATRDNGIFKLDGKEEFLRPELLRTEQFVLANQ